jgi:GDP-L-fucose synthase
MSRRPLSGAIYVAGHNGLVGSAIVRVLERSSAAPLVTREWSELDLRDAPAVDRFFAEERPAVVYLAAAKVGGIRANSTFPAEFIHDNLAVQVNVIHSAWRHGVEKLLFLGSSCVYPRLAPQPMREEHLLSGPLEPTNEWYAIAKIAGIKMCDAYRLQYGFPSVALMPTNLYGPGDNFSFEDSHVLPALIRRFHDAKLAQAPEVVVWGTGTPRREFLYVDDLAEAAVMLMEREHAETLVNVGTGEDISIAELAVLIKTIVGYEGRLRFDTSRPDGPPRKLLDVGRIHALGWRHRTSLAEGIAATYRWLLEHIDVARLTPRRERGPTRAAATSPDRFVGRRA